MVDPSPSTSNSQSSIAQRTWEFQNEVKPIDYTDEIYRYDEDEQKTMLIQKPWKEDVNYFRNAKISALAMLKMVMHARSGGKMEVMGLMTGKIKGRTIIILDSFALPVEGTETRVNAQAEAYIYMASYMDSAKLVGKKENVVGWYHSHPGYGCWLSGIDVSTQNLNQNFQDPFVAVVIDPIRTMSAGKVCLGAFRTYPSSYKLEKNVQKSEQQSIPIDKIEDFGVHSNCYYSLDVSYFKSPLDKKLLDSMWSRYWVNVLSTTSLLTNDSYTTDQILDLTEKLIQFESSINKIPVLITIDGTVTVKEKQENLQTIAKHSSHTTNECIHGLMSQVIKNKLFNLIH